jgi:glutamine synthetase
MTPAAANRSAQETRSVEDIKELFGKHAIDTVLIGGCDINGIFRGKRIPAWRFLENPSAPVHFADFLCIMDWQDEVMQVPRGYAGWWPSWDRGFGDLAAVPDLETLRVIPWEDRTAIVLCDYRDLHGNELAVMPRNVLKRVVDRAAAAGFTPIMTPEFEFTLFAETMRSLEEKNFCDPRPLAARPCSYGAELATRAEPVIGPIRRGLEAFGIPVEASNAESGPGQFEINMTPADAITSADAGFLFKFAVRQIAADHGNVASFMAKLAPGGFGSGCHVHQSLRTAQGTNAFYDGAADDLLSTVARQYVAGLVETMTQFAAVFAPTVNSYKRFEPEAAVGVTVTWAIQSKAVGIRVVNEAGDGSRVEHRTPGADANPYLTLAAMLAGGLWGIENDLDPGKPYSGNSYADPNVQWVPRTLSDAVEAFEQSEVANEFFGEEAVRYYAATRRWEIEQFNKAVTDWELRRYLTLA